MKKTPLEKELKYALSREEHSKLVRALRASAKPAAKSETHYFEDEAQSLRKQGIGFRARIVDGKKAVLTLKLPTKPKAGALRAYRVRKEYEKPLPLATARALIAGKRKVTDVKTEPVRVLVKQVGRETAEKLGVIGGIKMSRVKATLDDYTLEIDRFRVFKETHYELEIETDDAQGADKTVRALFRRLGIRYRPSSLSKLGRFLKAFKFATRSKR